MVEFIVKDSGQRQEFKSGMIRDTGDKPRYLRIFTGPMARRWAEHLHKGMKKYPDVKPGVPNWTLASGEAELQRFKESALDHMIKWLHGETDEDHGAAIFFNVNGAEYVKEKIQDMKDEQTATQVIGG
jgi:dATP/dGTP diphosphohydrolase